MATEEAIAELFPQCVVEQARRVTAMADARAGGAAERRVPTPAPDVDLQALASAFGSEDKCRAHLERLRWPDGVRCPRCDASRGISRIETRGQFDCDCCGYQFSVRVGTVFHDSHLPLWKWFLAVYVMGGSERGVSANQLKGTLGVSYKTAWYLCHRIRGAMKDEAPELPRRTVEADDRSVAGPYHHLSAKHLPAYLDEVAFRQSNRENAQLLGDTLLRLLGADPMRYTELISSA